MKQLKVGNWYTKLTPKEQAYFIAKVERFGVQQLRSFFSCARKNFPFQSEVTFKDALNLEHAGDLYYFSYDRKEFCKFKKEGV